MRKKHVIVIGAGPGGLSAAMILAHRGCAVTVFEKKPVVGGRNAPLRVNGFTFDTGPTFLMMDFILEEIFREAGRKASDHLKFTRLDPLYHLSFDDRDIFPTQDPDRMRAEIRRVFPGNEKGFDRFLRIESRRYQFLFPCIQKHYSTFWTLFSLRLLRALPHLGIGSSLFENLGRYFNHEKLKLSFTFQSKYLGMSPWDCPALFTMLPYVEHRYGILHVTGGLHRISQAMADVVREEGGSVRLSTPVSSLWLEGKTVKGVILENGEKVPADDVIVNADFAHAMTRLVPPGVLKKYSEANLRKKEYSCSTFMIYLGVNGSYPMNHHTIVFAKDYKANVNDIFHRKTLSNDVSFYVQNASATDPTLAPPGKSAIYILVPVPNRSSGIDWAEKKKAFRDQIIAMAMARTPMKDLASRIEAEHIMTPRDWEDSYDVFLGATFNLSHRISQLLYLRPRNAFEELRNCYLTGGGTHPGSGLPTIYESARITANLISDKYGIAHTLPSSLNEKLTIEDRKA